MGYIMAKVHINDVRELIEKSGYIRKQMALGARRIGNIHIGGPMSACDITTAIYYKYLGFDPENLDDPNRNQFILENSSFSENNPTHVLNNIMYLYE